MQRRSAPIAFELLQKDSVEGSPTRQTTERKCSCECCKARVCDHMLH